jgi:hypothetical protein
MAPTQLDQSKRDKALCLPQTHNSGYEDGAFVIRYPVTDFAADRLTPERLRQIIDRERRKAKRRQDADNALREG